MMDYEETKKYIQETAWGPGSNDTKIMATMLLEIEEHMRIANVLKLYEMGIVSDEELSLVKEDLRHGVGISAQYLKNL